MNCTWIWKYLKIILQPLGDGFLSFLLGRNIDFYNVFARCLGLTALRKNVKNLANSIPNISCMWSCTISRLFPWHKPGVFPWRTQQKKHFWKLFWWCSHNPKPCSGLCLLARGLLWPPKPENRVCKKFPAAAVTAVADMLLCFKFQENVWRGAPHVSHGCQ